MNKHLVTQTCPTCRMSLPEQFFGADGLCQWCMVADKGPQERRPLMLTHFERELTLATLASRAVHKQVGQRYKWGTW